MIDACSVATLEVKDQLSEFYCFIMALLHAEAHTLVASNGKYLERFHHRRP